MWGNLRGRGFCPGGRCVRDCERMDAHPTREKDGLLVQTWEVPSRTEDASWLPLLHRGEGVMRTEWKEVSRYEAPPFRL